MKFKISKKILGVMPTQSHVAGINANHRWRSTKQIYVIVMMMMMMMGKNLKTIF